MKSVSMKSVWYDPKTNQFVQVRRRKGKRLICGDFTDYYNDAQTTFSEQVLSPAYFVGARLADRIDRLKEAHHDGIGWRVQGEGIKPAQAA